MKMLSTKQLEEAVKIKYDTIKSYTAMGWIPKPTFQSSGRYGATLMWPMSVVYQLDMISVLKKSGYKNQDIGRILKGESL